MIRPTGLPASPSYRRGVSLVCALLAFAAIGALNAAGAAALGEQCSGSKVKGLGAFLQTVAQQRWAASELGFNGSPDPTACSGGQGSGGIPGASYIPVDSAAALRHWGAEDGTLHVKGLGFLANFLGTDIAPAGPVAEEGTMLAKMKAALGSDVVVVPVTQTSIAIAANPPALPAHPPCAVPRIKARELEEVFRGAIKNWRRLGAASDKSSGGDCDQAITRIVRDESAGTTYQFKHYLNSVNPRPLTCTGKSKRTWTDLQDPLGGASPPNIEWPRNADCQKNERPVTIVTGPVAEGELGPLTYVAKTPGTITYGSLPEAEQWTPEQVIDVHNGAKFASPATEEGEANCAAAQYGLPPEAASGVNVDWSQVYGSNPKIGKVAKGAYPICTLTWDVAAADSVRLFGTGAATTVHDYLDFVVAPKGGQIAVKHSGYQDLPSPVAEAAAAAVAQIDGEEEPPEEEGGPTVLCKSEPTLKEGVLDCPAGEGFSGEVTGEVKPETVTTFESVSGPEATVICTQGLFRGEFNEDGTGIFGGVSGFSYGVEKRCTSTFPGEPLTIATFANPAYYASKFVYTGPSAPQGFFQLARQDEAPPLLKFLLGGEASTCIYAPGALNNTVTNGSPTEMLMLGKWKLLEDSAEGACPTALASSSNLSMTRKGLPLYIAGKSGVEEPEEKEEEPKEEEPGEEKEEPSAGTVLCKSEPTLTKALVLDCPVGEGFSGKVTGTVVPETVATFEAVEGPEVNVTCPQGEYVGEFNEDGTSAGSGVTNFEFGLKEGCSTTFPEENEAVVSFENPPFDASQFTYSSSLVPQGLFTLDKSKGGPPLLRIQSSVECVYVPNFLEGSVVNGTPTVMTMQGKWKLAEEFPEEACPTLLAQTAHLTVTQFGEGLPLYMAGE
jgi:ABC-type phosphate transport system substrate-binding protein